MKITLEFPEFRSLIVRMGAKESIWKPPIRELSDREKRIVELEEGKEIPLEDVDTSFGALLTYQGEQVVLYIKDTRQDRQTLLYEFEKSKRFHIADCRTLNDMRQKGRFERYVVTNRKDGEFLVEATDAITGIVEELEAPLGVCRNCLTALNWKSYYDLGRPKHIWDEFTLEEFFAEFATFFGSKPRYSDKTAPPGGYAKDWSRIAFRLKKQRNWCCDECGVDLSDHPSLLHGHHKNGVVSDNRPENIDVLCIVCHSEQPAHQRLKPSVRVKIQIESLRLKRQGRTVEYAPRRV